MFVSISKNVVLRLHQTLTVLNARLFGRTSPNSTERPCRANPDMADFLSGYRENHSSAAFLTVCSRAKSVSSLLRLNQTVLGAKGLESIWYRKRAMIRA